MAEWIAELVLNWPPSGEHVVIGIAGLFKIGDIISDCFFVNSLVHFQQTFAPFLGVEAPNVTVFIAFASIFTIIGILFDIYKAYIVVQEHRGHAQTTWCAAITTSMRKHCFRCGRKSPDEPENDDSDLKSKFEWWKRTNLIFEEIPQLIILVAFYVSVRGVLVNCDIIRELDERCPDQAQDTYNFEESSAPFTVPSPTSPTPSPSNFFRRLEIVDGSPFDEDIVDILKGENQKAITSVGSIPRLIIQTSPSSSLDPRWKQYRESMEEMNPDFSIMHFTDSEALKFMEETFPDTLLLETYKMISRPVMKADLFRLAAVYALGGFYMDVDIIARQPFEPLTCTTYGAIFPKEWKQNSAEFEARHFRPPKDESELWQVGNYAFAASPRHEFIRDAINEAVARCSDHVLSSGFTDFDVLHTTGPYMLTEVYHEGRRRGKYEDIYFIPGDDTEPLRPRQYNHNDWHKFGPFAEHMLSHSWLSHEISRGLQQDFYEDFYEPTAAPSNDFYASASSQQCQTVERLIEQCSDDQDNAQVGLEESQQDLYISSILSTVFTLLTILGVIVVWCREKYTKNNSDEAGNSTQQQQPQKQANAPMYSVSSKPPKYDIPPNAPMYPTTPSVPAHSAPSSTPIESIFSNEPMQNTPQHAQFTTGVPAPASSRRSTVKVQTTFKGLVLDCAAARTGAVGLSIAKNDDGRFYVKNVREGGAAEAQGTIRVGDLVVAINHEALDVTWPLERVVQVIKSAVVENPQAVVLDVMRQSFQDVAQVADL